MMHKFSYEHNIEHNRSNIGYCILKELVNIYLEPNYANYLVIKNNKIIYKLWRNCSSHEHNIEHNRQFFEHCSKA